jgi:hypothetical protein
MRLTRSLSPRGIKARARDYGTAALAHAGKRRGGSKDHAPFYADDCKKIRGRWFTSWWQPTEGVGFNPVPPRTILCWWFQNPNWRSPRKAKRRQEAAGAWRGYTQRERGGQPPWAAPGAPAAWAQARPRAPAGVGSARAVQRVCKYRLAARPRLLQWGSVVAWSSAAPAVGFVRGHRAPVTTNNRPGPTDTPTTDAHGGVLCKRPNPPPAIQVQPCEREAMGACPEPTRLQP